jgi:hypothetical protein
MTLELVFQARSQVSFDALSGPPSGLEHRWPLACVELVLPGACSVEKTDGRPYKLDVLYRERNHHRSADASDGSSCGHLWRSCAAGTFEWRTWSWMW